MATPSGRLYACMQGYERIMFACTSWNPKMVAKDTDEARRLMQVEHSITYQS